MSTKTLITTPFGFDSTAAEVVAGIDLSGKRAIVTGASSGIGVETARALASAGADVTLAVRDTDAGERTVADITATTGNDAVRVDRLDLADQASVSAFVADWSRPLHLLINNAGVMAIPELERTPEGWEMQFATNHLGHFALALGLHDALADDGDARIVSLSSEAHLRSPMVVDDLNFRFRPYDTWLAYGQSKTANALFAVEATRRWSGDLITANAVHPGAVESNLARHMDPAVLQGLTDSGRYEIKTPEQGAATSVLVATSPQLEGIGGHYFADCNEPPLVDSSEASPPRGFAVAPYALDPDNAERLWDVSLRMLEDAVLDPAGNR
jgi:NAD(P)-dependent dehydrogenase (short-subunit alcohol dehydrogenase family)